MTKPSIIITGGANGIGLDLAQSALNNYRVVVLDIDSEALKQFSGSQIEYYAVDITDEEAIIETRKKIEAQKHNIVALINNAGIADPQQKAISELDLNDWNKMLSTNLTSMFLMVKHFSNALIESKGSIVNISSIRAFFSEPNTEAYSTAKSGVLGLTHALANSFAHKLRVNSISPGWIQTRVSNPPTIADINHHLVGRVGSTSDVVNLVMYLISEEASFITGQNFMLDGGVSVKLPYLN